MTSRAFSTRTLFFLFAGILVIAAFVFFYSTRFQAIERGLRLENHRSGQFTFDVWTQGQWRTTSNEGKRVDEMTPPYLLLLAIQVDDETATSVEIVEATLLVAEGEEIDALPFIDQGEAELIERPAAAIQSPYAAFRFEGLIKANTDIELRIRFRVRNELTTDEASQTILVPGYERQSTRFSIWESMMGA